MDFIHLKKTVERAFIDCFGRCPLIHLTNDHISLSEAEIKWTIEEQMIKVKRYRFPNRYRGVYWEDISGLVLTQTCPWISGNVIEVARINLIESPEYEIPRIIWQLLNQWATFRVRNFGSDLVTRAREKSKRPLVHAGR